MSLLHLICYDIPEDRIRNRVAHLLEGYGVRVQESVFECWLEPRHLSRLKTRLTRLVDAETDKIRIYVLCGKDGADCQYAGRETPSTDEDFAVA